MRFETKAGAADALRKHGARLKQRDDFGEGAATFGLWQKKIGPYMIDGPACRRYVGLQERRAPRGKGVDDMKTVLITGCSSGYGLETARHFHAQGWHVVATMRTPREGILPRSDRLRVLALDVTKPASIASAL